jgi:Flp pilus assembly protein protease CpaA
MSERVKTSGKSCPFKFKIIKKKEGMGYGDFKLLAALGAWIGWQAIPQLLLSASVLGLIFHIFPQPYQKKDTPLEVNLTPISNATSVLLQQL